MIFYLAWKNILSRKSSAVIVIFIAVALTLMTVINAVFETTEHGVETVYTNSFTADLVIRSQNNLPLSLFGDETPMTGSLTAIPLLEKFSEVRSLVDQMPQVAMTVPQVTVQAAVECNDVRSYTYVFGVPAQDYVAAMPSIRIIEGAPFADTERGVMLSTAQAAKLHAALGDDVQFIVQDKGTARIRAARVCAIYEYAVENSALEQMILTDGYTACSLAGFDTATIVEEVPVAEEKSDLLDDDFDWDDLFGNAEDTDAFFLDDFFADDMAEMDAEPFAAEIDYTAGENWNFLLVRLNNPQDAAQVLKLINRQCKAAGIPAEAVAWRNAAGSTALYLYWMRLIFNIGIIVILAAGFIIINNTLVVGVLNRTQEIGTLRAEGASRLFISLQCMIETFMLTISAGILACISGYIVSAAISAAGITFTNSFLIQLFGAAKLTFAPTLKTAGSTMGLSLLLGLLGWIYPVRTALRVTPVQAMQGAS